MRCPLLLLLLGVAVITTVWAGPLTLSERQALQGGTILVEEVPETTNGYRTFLAHAAIAAPIAEIYRVLLDFPAYPEFMPNVDKVIVRAADQHGARLDYQLGLPLGEKKRYRLQLTYEIAEDAADIRWQMLPWPELSPAETIRDTSGYWRLTRLDGEMTLVEYLVRTDPGEIPFGFSWIVDLLTKRSLPAVLESTRQRVYDVAGRGGKI
jgi:uncharacterized membrane protein